MQSVCKLNLLSDGHGLFIVCSEEVMVGVFLCGSPPVLPNIEHWNHNNQQLIHHLRVCIILMPNRVPGTQWTCVNEVLAYHPKQKWDKITDWYFNTYLVYVKIAPK